MKTPEPTQPQQVALPPQRPTFHFTPNAGWLNDPNGMVFFEGEYHLFYQHHPASTVWGPMHWGHAVSRNLLSWEELPIALAPDPIGTIFSGSAVIDREDTAGFGPNAMIAIFTHHTQTQGQVQSLAYSTDKGRTWTKYSGNPVLSPPEPKKDFRDPKVFWFAEGQHWVMALAVAHEIWFYRSSNLKEWALSSRFGAEFDSHDGVWECPELLQVNLEVTGAAASEKRWVLIVSVGNGAPAGGSGVQYFVGQFDGVTFISQDAPKQIRWMDFGADFYAPQAWNDAPNGRSLALAWMNNWSYANQVPDTGGWRGAMSLPRELLLRQGEQGEGDVVLVQQPVRELEALRKPCDKLGARKIDRETILLQGACGPAQDIRATFRVGADTSATYFGLHVCGNADGAIVIGYHTQHHKLILNRSAAGPKLPGFAAPHLAPLAPRNGVIALRVLIDQNSIEIFADDGRVVMTEQIFPEPGSHTVAVFAEDGAVDLESLILSRL